jgi:O-antigen ligase
MLGQFAVMLGFSWVFVHRFGTATSVRHLFVGVCLLALALLVTALLDPDVVIAAEQRRFRGEQIVPTGTGTLAAMGLVFCLSNVPRLRSAVFWGALVVFGGLLVWSRMRTAYVALVAYLVIGLLFGRGLRVRPLVGVFVAVSVGLLLIEAFAPAATYVVRDTQTIESLSDRIPLWSFLTEKVMRDEPVIGLGYFAASRVLGPQYNEDLGTAHSVFFEVLVGGGLVGAVSYLLFCASLLWYAGRLLRAAPGRPQTIVTVGLLAFCLVVGVTSTEAAHAGPVGFTFWCMTAVLPAVCGEAEYEAVLRARRVRSRGITSPVHALHGRPEGS